MCEHLILIDRELKSKGIKETFRGQPWSDNCREWVYYDCVFDFEKIRSRYNFPDFVVTHFNDDARSGLEAGFVCDQCKDGVIGAHPTVSKGKQVIA
jgi:hypothetical protein